MAAWHIRSRLREVRKVGPLSARSLMHQGSEQDERLATFMRSAQDGDREAYTALLGEVAALARGMVRRRFGFLQSPDIEDIVQDVLLSVHAARSTYDPGRPFVPWLRAIVRHRMADGARRYTQRIANELASDRLPETFPAEEANMLMDRYGDAEALARAMAGLPPGQRKAIELIKLREMSLKEASAASGVSVGALKVAVHRGVAALRKALTGRG